MNVFSLSNLGSNTTNSTWSPQSARRMSILDSTNPNFPRNVFLDTTALVLSRPGIEPVILTLSAFYAACAVANPNLTWSPICTNQPNNSNVANHNATGFVTAYSAETAITYKWQQSLNAGYSWTNMTDTGVYTNTTTNTVNISNTSGLDLTYYRCLGINNTGNTPSNMATLRVLPDPSITLNPISASVVAPSGVSFTIAAVGATSLSYQWQLSTNAGSSYSNQASTGVYSGATSVTMTISNVTGLGGNLYRCTATDSNGSVNSTGATLTVT